MSRLQTLAPAKVNLTLCVLARRSEGYHDLSSLVAFADIGDELALEAGTGFSLATRGPMAAGAGSPDHNLVRTAALAMQARIERLKIGRF